MIIDKIRLSTMDNTSSFPNFKCLALLTIFVIGIPCTFTVSFSDHSVTYSGPNVMKEGYPFTIKCVMNIKDLGQWTLNSERIDRYNERGYTLSQKITGVFHKELTLSVEAAQLYHAGEYRCNGYSRDYHDVDIIEEDEEDDEDDDDDDAGVGDMDDDDDEEDDGTSEVSRSRGDIVLDMNKTVTLHCTAAENDDSPVFWYKNSRQIMPDDGSRVKITRTHLTIENAQLSDAAEYMCKVESPNPTGLKEIGWIFQVKSPVKVKDFPSPKISVMQERNFTLFCDVGGFPSPKITWYKDNLPVINRMEANPTRIWLHASSGQRNAYLTVRAVTHDDRGMYTCKAENSIEAGTVLSDEKSVFVNVRENIIETNEDEPGLKLLVIGKDLVLQCNTTQCPQCQVVWYKDGKLLEGKVVDDDEEDEEEEYEDDYEDHVIINKTTNSVTIQQASYNDSGVYVCAIDRTKLDVALNASIEVQTEVKLEKFESASDVVVEGHPLILYCLAKAAPNPSIKWFKGETEVSSSDKRIQLLEHNGLKNAKLYIEEADYEDRANYSCEAYNRVHSAKIAIFIRIKDRLAALWPFLGICVEVAILCTVIFVYEKRKSAESNEADTDLPGDNRNVRDQSQRGQAVRQRK